MIEKIEQLLSAILHEIAYDRGISDGEAAGSMADDADEIAAEHELEPMFVKNWAYGEVARYYGHLDDC